MGQSQHTLDPQSIPIRELEYFMPHRHPMIWIDEVLSFDATSGATLLTIRPDSPMLDGQGKLMVSTFLEFFAQSYGYLQGARARSNGSCLEVVYLAAVDSFVMKECQLPEVGDTLVAKLWTVRNLEPLHIVSGTIEDLSGNLFCELRIKGFARFASKGS